MKAFQTGYDGVLVSGCHPGDCHYLSGNYFARRKFAVIKPLMEFIGLEPDRLQFSWVSAGEGERFSEVVTKVTNDIKKIGPVTKMVKGV